MIKPKPKIVITFTIPFESWGEIDKSRMEEHLIFNAKLSEESKRDNDIISNLAAEGFASTKVYTR